MTLTLILSAAITLDYCLGEPRNAYHPLVAFGRWVTFLETSLLNPAHSPFRQQMAGLLALVCALFPGLLLVTFLGLLENSQTLLSIIILYLCIGSRSLEQHAKAVYQALKQQDLPMARQRVGYMVSRQTDYMTAIDVRRATIESVLENGNDAVFAPLFWFVLLGPYGVLLYRLTNTLDAMWGYKNQRYRYFGWAAARFDDGLNWLPARLTALSYALLGNTRQAIQSWRRHAHLLASPNAGPVMTAGAGTLNLSLGGPATYHGQLKDKPWFGGSKQPDDQDILRAIRLIYQTLACWWLLIAMAEYVT